MADRRNRQRVMIGLVATLAVLVLIAPHGVLAQQGSFPTPAPVPKSQSSGTGTTLELPITRQQTLPSTDRLKLSGPQNGPELSIAPRELRHQAGYEQVTVTVTNQHGAYESDLKRDDFKLYVDGVQRPIQFFRHDANTPVSVGILVDTSGSMEPKLAQARAAITQFVNDLNPADDVFLFAFSNHPYLLQPFTTNHSLVKARLEILYAQGETALFDTIIDGLLMVRHGKWDKKALLVLTDGMDNESQSDVAQVVAYARRMGVLIYTIGIGDPNAAPVGLGPFILGNPDQVDASTLRTLSTETGAKTFVLREVGDGAALRNACASMSSELQEQYTVGFVAPDASRGGYRTLRVDTPMHPDDKVRVRKGVTITPDTESADASAP